MAEIEDIVKVPQRKLSELVTTFVHNPRIIFLDEPTNAMDLINARTIRESIREKEREGEHAIILTSHNMSDIEQVCERVAIINRGKIVFDGSIRDLNRMDGLNKQIRLIFNGPWTIDQLQKIGEIRQMNGQEILLDVEHDQAASVASHLFTNLPVKDISITDPPLERIIESIYLRSNV